MSRLHEFQQHVSGRGLSGAAALAALLTWLICWQPFSGEEKPSAEVALQCRLLSTTAGSLSVRIDEGHGIATNVPAYSAVTFAASPAPQVVTLRLPPGRIRMLRLGFYGSQAISISGLRIHSREGKTLTSFEVSKLKPVAPAIAQGGEDSRSVRADREATVRKVEPALQLRSSTSFIQCEAAPPTPVYIPSGNEPWPVEVAGTFLLLTFLLMVVAAALPPRVSLATRERGSRLLASIQEGALRSPVLTLGLVGLFSAVLSCSPVVFLGRSFVAPANGAPLLYLGTPTLPGAPAEPSEDMKGSDVGAMFWQNLPYSALQHRAIFQDGEWPLWNRYNNGGLPLLGQGLSSLGDPLHWLTILAKGASWAWDAKFIIAKALFAFGMGLCAWQVTRHLGVAVLLGASSAWIGFFAFRFNHPAFFGVCYAPWVLLPWLAMRHSATWRTRVGWMAALALADLMEFQSGTVKEATMLLLCLNGAGLLVLALQPTPWRERVSQIAALGWASLLFVLLSAPSWLLFLDALGKAATLSEAPQAYQQQPGLLLAFFDEIFSQDFTHLELHTHPSVNGLVLSGVLWLAATWRRHLADRAVVALSLATLPLFALVYGVIPPGWITRLPFIGNLQHIDNIFGCVLVILLPLLAAAGLADCWRTAHEPWWTAEWRRALWLGALLLLAYLGFTQALAQHEAFGFQTKPPLHSRFYLAYAPALLLAVTLLPLALQWLRRAGEARWPGLALLTVCLLVLHFRHGMYTETKFDAYVMNPKTGFDLTAPSLAIDRVQRRLTEPFRTYGLFYTLSPGYATLLGLEGISGPDPLANRGFRELCRAAGFPHDFDWRVRVDEATLAQQLPVYDLLNQRFYLRDPDTQPPPALTKVGQADLEIYESKTAWPRAFYTSQVGSYRTVADFLDLVRKGDGQPFAARHEPTLIHSTIAPRPHQSVAARDYVLTSNSTSFTIEAPDAGTLVLAENYEEGNFRLTVNGAPAEYFRVNHFAKGLSLPAAGTYRISYTYHPRFWTLSLLLASVGCVLALLTPLASWSVLRSKPTKATGSF